MQRTRKYFDTTFSPNKNVVSFMEDEAVAQYLCASECVNPIQMMSMEQYQGWNLTTLSFVKTWNTIFYMLHERKNAMKY